MITFDPFWELMRERKITVYNLEYSYGLNPADISRLKHNHNYTMNSLDRFCNLFHCQPGDLIVYQNQGEIYLPEQLLLPLRNS